MLKNGFSKNKLLCIQSIMKIFEIKIRFFLNTDISLWDGVVLCYLVEKNRALIHFNWQLQLSLFIFARRFQFFNNFQEIFRPLNLSIPFFSLESNRNWILIADKHATWLSTTWLLIDLIEYCTISIAVQLEKLYSDY